MSTNILKSPDTAAFFVAYNALNPEQKQAVDAIEGPVMVIAGPGTGKTQILTLRIANILLKTDTAPESILALTFTESGAKAMRERLHRYIGVRAYQVHIHTFHGFAGKLIRHYPEAYDRIIGGRPITDIEKITLLEDILDSSDIKLLRPSGNVSYYVRPLERMISELKKEYVSPDGLSEIIAASEKKLLEMERYHEKGAHKGKERGEYSKAAKNVAKNYELLFVYRRYEAGLRSGKLYDFEDMILETVLALEGTPDMLQDLEEQYQYLLADEHQDVNGAQNRILELLASYHDQPNIFVVGDEKQAIYRFQGASLHNFLYFSERFSGTTVISLTRNYRSGQTILDAAHSLVAVDGGPLAALRVPLTAAAVPMSTIAKRIFSHQSIEDAWVVSSIKEALAAQVEPSQIAVIVRSNREVETYTSLLRAAGVPVTASADGDILEHPITLSVVSLLQAVVRGDDEAALFTILHGAYWGLSAADLVKISRARTYDVGLVAILSSTKILDELTLENRRAVEKVIETLQVARVMQVTEPPHRVLQYLLQESGFLDFVITHNPLEGERVVRRLYDEVEGLVLSDTASSLSSVVTVLAQRRAYNLPLTAPYISSTTHSVFVMTAHKSKGLEFERVYIPHLQDGVWGGGRHSELFTINLTTQSEIADAFDDELRLLYVAMTRAKTALFFSTAAMSTSGKEMLPTRFFDVINESYITPNDTDEFEAHFSPLLVLQQVGEVSGIDAVFIKHALETKGFSATSFNNCVANPWDYLYRNVLKVPEVQATHLQFGTAVHAVLEYVTRQHTESGTLPTATQIKIKLENALGRLPMSVSEYTRQLQEGLELLVPYIEHLGTSLPERTVEELSISVMLETGISELPFLPLTGKLDRIDLDSNGIAYRVVDYKTGKPKSRNEIEGKTASSDGAYKRQLVFYALLLSLYGDERYQTTNGVLSFVQSAKSGKVKEEAFSITHEEIAALKQHIVAIVKELLSGAFLADQKCAFESSYPELATAFIALQNN